MKFIQKLKKYWGFLTKTLLLVQTTIILAVVYFFIFVPFALVWKAFQPSPSKKESFWTAIPRKSITLEDFYEQY